MNITERYRPKTFDEVLGHKSVVHALTEVLKDRTLLPHAYLFSGPSGVGKTSLARILAQELGCKPYNIIEQDSTVHSSVEAMRELVAHMRIPAMGASPFRAVILDEVQDLNKTVWETILKDVEESPAHLFWILCTTEPEKLPPRLTTRFHPYILRPLRREVLKQRLTEIKVAENYSISDEMIDAILDKSKGSMRGALTLLSTFRASEDAEGELEEAGTPSSEMMEMCRTIVGRQPVDLNKLLRCDAQELRQALIWFVTNKVLMGKPSNPTAWKAFMRALASPITAGTAELLYRLTDHELLDPTKPREAYED